MQEINKHSPEVAAYGKRVLNENFIRIDETPFIYFTRGVILKCDLKAGEYLHFINDYEDWKFYSNDNADGFKLLHAKRCLRVVSAPLARLILKTTGFNKRKNFYVRPTRIVHDKCPVFQLTPNA